MSLIKDIAERTEQKPTLVRDFLDALLEELKDGLTKTRKFRLPHVAIFSVKFRPAKPVREGRNPATGETVTLKAKPASNKLAVRPAKELKEMVADMKVIKPKKKGS